MKKWCIGVWHPSVIMTYAGLAFSSLGIGVALSGHISLALVFLVLAALCDMFDGVVARRFNRSEMEKEFGIQIDSLADVCSFVVFPVCLLFCVCKENVATYIIAAVYAVMGVARLAWFNIVTHEDPNFFFGLPVTYSALLVPATYILLSLLRMNSSVENGIFYALYVLMAVLFVCNFKTKKPGLVFRLFMLGVAIGLMVVLLFAI